MPLRMFDFLCSGCGATFERMVNADDRETECPECGNVSHKLISPVRSCFDGTDPGFPTAYDRWAKIREDRARKSVSRKP